VRRASRTSSRVPVAPPTVRQLASPIVSVNDDATR
jgi:hypothetical protein